MIYRAPDAVFFGQEPNDILLSLSVLVHSVSCVQQLCVIILLDCGLFYCPESTLLALAWPLEFGSNRVISPQQELAWQIYFSVSAPAFFMARPIGRCRYGAINCEPGEINA